MILLWPPPLEEAIDACRAQLRTLGKLRPKSPHRICIPLSGCGWIYRSNFDVVTELAKRPCETLGAVLLNLGIAFVALLHESNSLCKVFQRFYQLLERDLQTAQAGAERSRRCCESHYSAMPSQSQARRRMELIGDAWEGGKYFHETECFFRLPCFLGPRAVLKRSPHK